MTEVYVSTDIEANGPIPGPNSMLALGAGAFSITESQGVKLIDSFSANLQELDGATAHPATMAWWLKYPEAWELNRKDPLPPELAMNKYLDWLGRMPGKPVFIAWPATYDFMFVYWYLIKFTGQSPFQWSGLDAKSYMMGATKKNWRDISLEDIQSDNFLSNPQPHVAVYDAIDQGWRICQMMHANMFDPQNQQRRKQHG